MTKPARKLPHDVTEWLATFPENWEVIYPPRSLSFYRVPPRVLKKHNVYGWYARVRVPKITRILAS